MSFELNTDEAIEFQDLNLLLTDIIFEEIIECPGDDSMPSGSGVVVFFQASNNNKSEDISLNVLSQPYESTSSVIWDKYKITLVKVVGYNKPSVTINIDVLD